MVHYTYILFSRALNKYYIGYTSDLNERIKKHNSNHKGFTGGVPDWELKWFEKSAFKEVSLKREKELKKWKSRIMIEKLISSAGSAHPDLSSGGSRSR